MNFPFNLFQLEGRVALITGGSGGLGKMFARTLAGAGADVALLARQEAGVRAAAAELASQTGRRALGVAGDVTEASSIAIAVRQVVDQLGPIDILINSAGVNVRKPSLAFSDEDWRRVLDVSLTGSFFCSREVAGGMVERRWGRVINISSMLGLVGLGERPAYTAAKGGMIQLTRTLALEWARHNVTVNALAPGPFVTELNRPLLDNPVAYRAFTDRVPMDRWGQPEELAGAILFLASEASSFMTGAVLTVDGGWTAQ